MVSARERGCGSMAFGAWCFTRGAESHGAHVANLVCTMIGCRGSVVYDISARPCQP